MMYFINDYYIAYYKSVKYCFFVSIEKSIKRWYNMLRKEERRRVKMAATMAQVKPLKGKQAKEFKKAFEASGIKKEAFSKAIDAMKKGFISK